MIIFPNRQRRQGGAVAVTMALLLLLMLGFIGLSVDLGHLFVIRTELQTAVDACALAGAQELDGEPDALTRATRAGIAAGNANGVNLQSATWSGQPQLTATDIVFRDKDQNPTTSSTAARYVRCSHTQAGTSTPLLHMLANYASSSAYAATMNVGAFAEATTTPAQSTCPLPLALVIDQANKTLKPPFGYNPGDWVTLLINQSNTSGGQIGWANLSGKANGSASDLASQLAGYCGSKVNDPLYGINTNGAAGVKSSVIPLWNGRFGIYKKPDDISTILPDYTGYGYTTANWATPNAGMHCPNTNDAYCDFVRRRQTFDACGGVSTPTVKSCGDSMGIDLGSDFKVVASGGTGGLLRQYATNRRIASVPVVTSPLSSNAATNIVDFACVLILQPIPAPNSTTQVSLEYLGKASDVGSPCTGNGLPGGNAGPLVPVLVQ